MKKILSMLFMIILFCGCGDDIEYRDSLPRFTYGDIVHTKQGEFESIDVGIIIDIRYVSKEHSNLSYPSHWNYVILTRNGNKIAVREDILILSGKMDWDGNGASELKNTYSAIDQYKDNYNYVPLKKRRQVFMYPYRLNTWYNTSDPPAPEPTDDYGNLLNIDVPPPPAGLGENNNVNEGCECQNCQCHRPSTEEHDCGCIPSV